MCIWYLSNAICYISFKYIYSLTNLFTLHSNTISWISALQKDTVSSLPIFSKFTILFIVQHQRTQYSTYGKVKCNRVRGCDSFISRFRRSAFPVPEFPRNGRPDRRMYMNSLFLIYLTQSRPEFHQSETQPLKKSLKLPQIIER